MVPYDIMTPTSYVNRAICLIRERTINHNGFKYVEFLRVNRGSQSYVRAVVVAWRLLSKQSTSAGETGAGISGVPPYKVLCSMYRVDDTVSFVYARSLCTWPTSCRSTAP